jgi:hypothetical protein
VIFTAKYHLAQAEHLKALAQKSERKTKQRKLLALANVHEKLAKYSQSTNTQRAAELTANVIERRCRAEAQHKDQARSAKLVDVAAPPLVPRLAPGVGLP